MVILVCPYAIKGATKVQIIKTLTQAGKCTLKKGEILFKRQQFDRLPNYRGVTNRKKGEEER